MFWEKCNIGYFNSGSKELVKISGLEVQNKKPFWVYISKEAFDNIQNGVSLSTALKDFSLEIREFLISGFAPTENSIFSFQRDPIQNAFITNSVANSVVFYAMAYLNNKGLSPIEIKNLRLKYSFGNLDKRYFNMEELKSSFVSQSAFFLNLYKEMNENDRFEHFVENLGQQNRFKEVFRNYNDFISLKRQYNRRVFHDKLECEYMRSDYNEEIFHKNTGVFSEKEIIKKQNYYTVDRVYLSELKMRLCKVCGKE
ncbi:hypothetical protein [Tenacibaculum piscium]|uniref:hypothetical protein n=1 Tax=Tenacibaculum piscium TaxID=1458515 RepID=UPI001F28B34C|nr:hypothetical protein [Tenacibaculum piscium]